MYRELFDRGRRECEAADISMTAECVYCEGEGGQRLWGDARCRVVLADEPFTGFCRVIWNAHVREMTDLDATDRDHLMHVTFAVERVLRARLSPLKMNLASLGNVTPHVHWHVIARFPDDSHYPQPVWGTSQRPRPPASVPPTALAARLAADLAAALGPGS